MNAMTEFPADLLADAFKCAGTVKATSPAWHSDAVTIIERRLAAAWAAERQTEKPGPTDYKLRETAEYIAHRAKVDEDVFAAVPNAPTLDDLEAILDHSRNQIQLSLARLKRTGRLNSRRTCDVNTYAQAAGGHLQREDGGKATHGAETKEERPRARNTGAAVEAAARKKAARRAETLAKVRPLVEAGTCRKVIATQLGISPSYVKEIICRMRRGEFDE